MENKHSSARDVEAPSPTDKNRGSRLFVGVDPQIDPAPNTYRYPRADEGIGPYETQPPEHRQPA